MENLIAIKRVGRHAAGKEFRARAHEARALIALGFAAKAPKKTPPAPVVQQRQLATDPQPKRPYIRRDMVAAQPMQPANVFQTKSDVEA